MEWSHLCNVSSFEVHTGRRKDVFPQHDEWQTFILRDFDLKKHLLTLHISISMTHAKKCLRTKSTFSDTKKPLKTETLRF